MTKRLLVENEILIHAPASKVWGVLVEPRYMKQWDDLPEGYGEDKLALGNVIEWEGYSILTVTRLEPDQQLQLSLYVPKWELPPESYSIAYTYTLTPQGVNTLLSVTIGDFAQLADGEPYYDASVEFAAVSLPKIKELAEQ